MRGFARRSTVAEAIGWLDSRVRRLGDERTALREAGGRVLAHDVASGVDVPGFVRAMMLTASSPTVAMRCDPYLWMVPNANAGRASDPVVL